jgi:NAD-dependent dihydropyrimidine dehydrogenase PreA subunit
LPVLDATRCTGCADCVAVCPTDCLVMNGTTPWMPRPLDCVVCALCVRVCPTDALRMGEGREV